MASASRVRAVLDELLVRVPDELTSYAEAVAAIPPDVTLAELEAAMPATESGLPFGLADFLGFTDPQDWNPGKWDAGQPAATGAEAQRIGDELADPTIVEVELPDDWAPSYQHGE